MFHFVVNPTIANSLEGLRKNFTFCMTIQPCWKYSTLVPLRSQVLTPWLDFSTRLRFFFYEQLVEGGCRGFNGPLLFFSLSSTLRPIEVKIVSWDWVVVAFLEIKWVICIHTLYKRQCSILSSCTVEGLADFNENSNNSSTCPMINYFWPT